MKWAKPFVNNTLYKPKISAQMMSRPSNLNTIHWQATTEPSFVTKPRPSNWEKPAGKPKPTKKFTTTTSKPHKNYQKPKDPNKTEDSTQAPIQTTAATNSVGEFFILVKVFDDRLGQVVRDSELQSQWFKRLVQN